MQSQKPGEAKVAETQRPPAPGVDYDAATGGAASAAGNAFAEQLATALAQFTGANQTGPKPIPPALQRQRAKAHAEMLDLLATLSGRGETPLYELRKDFYCDDVLVPEGTKILYGETPNEAMAPLNEPARRVVALFMRSIGGQTPDLGDQSYEAYLNRPRRAQVLGEENRAPSPLGRPGSLADAKVTIIEDEEPREAATYLGPRRVMGSAPVERPGAI